ncbi:hypothetical protein SXCC_02865 [Gluconacetobacter sp. SXCC-1]|nr:hypothetical protein SXCC_02865 [Gluconacetobacter sp. SXCC-1]
MPRHQQFLPLFEFVAEPPSNKVNFPRFEKALSCHTGSAKTYIVILSYITGFKYHYQLRNGYLAHRKSHP